MNEEMEKLIKEALSTPEGRTALSHSMTHPPEWKFLSEISETLKNIEKILNAGISSVQKWGPKISHEQFQATETIIKDRQVEIERQRELPK